MDPALAPARTAMPRQGTPGDEIVIRLEDVQTRFGDHVVHRGVDLEVRRAEILALVGGSGSGKSTLLREMLLLHRPDGGRIEVLGQDLRDLAEDDDAARTLRMRWGMLFQHGGLFGALSVRQNVGLPLREHTRLPDALVDRIAQWKIRITGLEPDAADQLPGALSGGMRKRAALARALVMDPELLFLDEPTAGLDPESAAGVDELVLQLRALFGLTIVVVTHDLDSLWRIADRVAVLGEGRVQAIGSMQALSAVDNPAVRPFFDGPRARAAQPTHHLTGETPSRPR